jgi:hypothetical protein
LGRTSSFLRDEDLKVLAVAVTKSTQGILIHVPKGILPADYGKDFLNFDLW